MDSAQRLRTESKGSVWEGKGGKARQRTRIVLEHLGEEQDIHNPSKQPGNSTGRCSQCSYAQHPCRTYDAIDEAIKEIITLDKESRQE